MYLSSQCSSPPLCIGAVRERDLLLDSTKNLRETEGQFALR
eukprot:gene26578-biopygen16917